MAAATIFAVLLGAVLGAWFTVEFSQTISRKQITIQLLERYCSIEFSVVRGEVWRIQDQWFNNGERGIVKHFVDYTDKPAASDQEGNAHCSNGLTPHQNLSWLLHFYASLCIYYNQGLVKRSLLVALFGPQFAWYRRFYRDFCEEFKRERAYANCGQPDPVWLTAWPTLDRLFQKFKTEVPASTQPGGAVSRAWRLRNFWRDHR